MQETLKPKGYTDDRYVEEARASHAANIIKDSTPLIFGVTASSINDGVYAIADEPNPDERGIGPKGMTHEQIGYLLLFAIESGGYVNI